MRYVAFDVLAADGADLRDRPYTVRRAQLVELLDRAAGAEPSVVDLVPASDDREAALSWMAPHWSALGIEGIVAKRLDSPYVAGRRAGSPWVKVRQRVVGGVLVLGVTGPPTGPAALVLGPLPAAGAGDMNATDEEPVVAGVSAALPRRLRADLAARLRPVGPPGSYPRC